jgi:hypothetical protein
MDAGVVIPDNVLFETGLTGEGIHKLPPEGFSFHTRIATLPCMLLRQRCRIDEY